MQRGFDACVQVEGLGWNSTEAEGPAPCDPWRPRPTRSPVRWVGSLCLSSREKLATSSLG